MTTAAQAFAPGSPAGGASGVAALSGLKGMAAGLPSIPSLTQTSSATGQATSVFDNSGFVVNFGSGSAGGAIPQWALLGGLAAAAYWVLKVRQS